MQTGLTRREFSFLTTALGVGGTASAAPISRPLDIKHSTVQVDGVRLHVSRAGQGRPLLLLHGWPELALTWEPVMSRLQDRFELIAPDLRGFGDSDATPGSFGPEQQAGDIAMLLDRLGVGPVGVVSHDIGGAAAQALARHSPERVAGLFFFDFIYPGVGDRFFAPDRLDRVWYFFFQASALAPPLVGSSPEEVRLYLTYFLDQWAYRSGAFDDVLPKLLSAYQRPGRFGSSLAHYRASVEAQETSASKPAPGPIDVPTCVRWAEHDPLFDYAWTDRLPEFFPHVDVALFPGVGHFPHREDPDGAAREIGRFFESLDAGRWNG